MFHPTQLLLELLELYQSAEEICFSFHPPPPRTEAIITEFFVYHLLSFCTWFCQKLSPNSIYLILPDFLSLIKMENQSAKNQFQMELPLNYAKYPKLLEENTEQYLYDLCLGEIF